MRKRKVFMSSILVSTVMLNSFATNISALINYEIQAYSNNDSSSLENNKDNVNNEEIKIEGLDNVKIEDFNCSLKLNEILSKIQFLLKEYKINKTEIYLAKAIELFGDIGAFAKDVDLYQFGSEETMVSNLFNTILEEIYNIDNNIISGKYLIEFSKEILFGWRKNKIDVMYPDRYLVFNLVDYNRYNGKLDIVQKDLDKIKTCYYYLLNTESENNDSEILPNIESLDDEDGEGTYVPDYEFENTGKPEDDYIEPGIKEPEISTDIISGNSSYEKRGDKCYLVDREYKNGVIISEKLNNVPKKDYVHCGIYEDIFSDINTQINNIIDTEVKIDREYIESNQNEGSTKYVYYTDRKNDIIPYYYNSGILADAIDESITYNQLKDVFYQLCIKKESPFVISNGKSLFILEGKPIIVGEEKEKYSKSEVESMLNSFKSVGFKITEEIGDMDTELKDLIDSGDYITLKHKDKEYILNNIYIESSFVVASIQEVVGYFGYNTELLNDRIVVRKKNYVLEIDFNSKVYNLNGEIGEFNVSTQMKEDEWYCDLGKLMEIIGYDIEWNAENSYFEVR